MGTYSVLTDTSVIIDFLRKENKKKAILWKIRERNECFMSSVTFFELQCGVRTERHIEDTDRLCKWIKSIPLDNEIAEIASIIYHDLKRKNEIVEFRDIFIAAQPDGGQSPPPVSSLLWVDQVHFCRWSRNKT